MPSDFTVIRDTTPSTVIPRGTVVAMGNFDGVHLGHRAVISAALQMGRARNDVLGYLLSFSREGSGATRALAPSARVAPLPSRLNEKRERIGA